MSFQGGACPPTPAVCPLYHKHRISLCKLILGISISTSTSGRQPAHCNCLSEVSIPSHQPKRRAFLGRRSKPPIVDAHHRSQHCLFSSCLTLSCYWVSRAHWWGGALSVPTRRFRYSTYSCLLPSYLLSVRNGSDKILMCPIGQTPENSLGLCARNRTPLPESGIVDIETYVGHSSTSPTYEPLICNVRDALSRVF